MSDTTIPTGEAATDTMMDYEEKNRRILVVDDTASIHDDVRTILTYGKTDDRLSELELAVLGTKPSSETPISYEIDSAYQGEEGFKMAVKAREEGRPYALAIVDVRMPPGWDGIQTVERMREVDPELQVAICTAYSDYSWQGLHEKFGTNDWLLIFKKPFDLAEVQQLACTMTEKWNLARQASMKMGELEERVEEHARQLRAANEELQKRNASLADANDRLSEEMNARRLADERIRHIAFHDALTDLPNRTLLMERLNECIARSRGQSDYMFAVLFTDVDDFKIVNDSLGHRVGDQLLSQVASEMIRSMRTIPDSIRPSCDTVARLGGDEFVILLDDVKSVENVVDIAERLQKTVCRPLNVAHREIVPSISIGAAVSRHDYDDAVDIMRDADTALYHAKANGKGCVSLFDQAMRSRVLERVDLENDLWHAVDANQFIVYYQPIVSLADGKMAGLEALLRWNHPTRGLLLPASFIQVAEETGMIAAIGEVVVEEVSRQLSEWKSRFLQMQDLSVSLNLSACQLVSYNLVKQIDHCLETYNLDPSSLKLELTETTMMDNLAMMKTVIDEITSRKIEIHLDDFGTGYSSLSILHTLPFAALKLDRSFVNNLGKDLECETTIQAIVMMARNRRIKLIAEGVETYEQLVMLRDLDCEYGQGFYFSPPVPPEQIESLIESGGRYSVTGGKAKAGLLQPALEGVGAWALD
jgi:diguanylate cyclase (GGDEF)-like protein